MHQSDVYVVKINATKQETARPNLNMWLAEEVTFCIQHHAVLKRYFAKLNRIKNRLYF